MSRKQPASPPCASHVDVIEGLYWMVTQMEPHIPDLTRVFPVPMGLGVIDIKQNARAILKAAGRNIPETK